MKYILSVVLLCFGLSLASAQEVYTSSGRPQHAKKEQRSKGFDPDRLIFGGSAQVGFGSGVVDLGISPLVGYRITNNFSAGVGFGYEYVKGIQIFPDPNTGQLVSYPSKATLISPNVWARYKVFRNIFVQSQFEYDIIHYSQYNYDNGNTLSITQQPYNVNVPCLLIGAGIIQPVGGRMALIASVSYDVLQNVNSPYYGTIIPNIGFIVGL